MENSDKSEKDYKAAYFKKKKQYDKLIDQMAGVAENTQIILNEEEALRFMVFCIAVQLGGSFEITEDTIKVANEMYEKHDLSVLDNGSKGAFCEVKRREK